jgi:flavin reductase (DIM6/NTAB) family NADH-FMN oxidoreductase RutF
MPTNGAPPSGKGGAWAERAEALALWAWRRLVNRADAWGAYRPPEEWGREFRRRVVRRDVARRSEAMSDSHFSEPRHGLPHDPFKAIVAPRPIGWISTVDAQGRANLAPFSFFNALCEAPPLVGFSSGGRKDSQRNAEATGKFVINLATRRHAEAMNLTSAPFPPGVSEFEAGLAQAPSRLVRPPRVSDAPAALECKVVLVLPLKGLEGELTPSTLVLGQVVGVHIDPAFLKGGLFDLVAAGTIARCGYRGDYAQVTALFEMLRPTLGPTAPDWPG